MRVLSADDVRQAVPMSAAITVVAAAFAQLAVAGVTLPLRTPIALPERDAVCLFMPAHIAAGPTPALGLKVVSVFPQNAIAHARPTISALVVLFDPETGQPLAMLDGTYLTALRTGAVAGVATDLLARPDAHRLAIFGAGAQALPQILAVCAVRPIDTIWIVNRTRDHAAILAATLRSTGYRGDVMIAAHSGQALAEADIVSTVTAATQPLFDDREIQPGTHINALGAYKPSMAEIPAATLARARIIVDQRAAAWAEAGDLIQARAAGLIDDEDIVGELGALVRGDLPGRTDKTQVTLFKSVGNAVQDLAVAAFALTQATALGLGVEIAL